MRFIEAKPIRSKWGILLIFSIRTKFVAFVSSAEAKFRSPFFVSNGAAIRYH